MKDTFTQIRLLIKLVYLMIVLVALYNIALFITLLYPGTGQPLENTKDQPVTAASWRPKSLVLDVPDGESGEYVRYGYLLITETSRNIGPGATEPSMRFAGNNLTCNNCHLDAGRKIGAGAFVGVTNRFPQFRGRENKMGTIEDRINGCMERSMNGSVLDSNSKEMQSIVKYMEWLSEDVPAEIDKLYQGYTTIKLPEVMADTAIGKKLYLANCERCHLSNGEGMKQPGENALYIYPPIGGFDSFNDGAGMNRVITAAEFIKGNMPFGVTYDSPQLTDDEAYHIAAYISSFPRPSKPNKEADFPDKKLKPVSTDYGPWADNFSPEQHKFGPFQPIFAFYKEQYDLNKRY